MTEKVAVAHRDELRERNEERSQRDAEQGPAEKNQDAAPILDAMRVNNDEHVLEKSIPTHNKGKAAPKIALDLFGEGLYRNDVSMLAGADNRHESWQVRTTAEELFAEAVGADQTLFSTNGSTTSVHTALHTVTRPGEKILVSRNSHMSVVTGLVLCGASPVWVMPEYDEELEVAHGVTPEAVASALDQNPDAVAVMIVTPTYYGVSADVRGIADECHRRDLPLVTDDAWGLAYWFHAGLPPSALECGADFAIGSVHKTIAGLGQTSVMSTKGDRIDQTRLTLSLELFESTSVSAILLASIDAARHEMVHRGSELIGRSLELVSGLREQLESIDGLRVITEADVMRSPGAFAFNPQHVTVDLTGLQITGFEAADWLRDQRKIDVELAEHRRVMLMVSIGDDEDSVKRTVEAFAALSEAHREGKRSDIFPEMPTPMHLRTEQAMTPRDAFFAPVKTIPLRESIGQIGTELITPYPPGIPVLVPGEVITPAIVEYLDLVAAAGGLIQGAADSSLRQVRVVDKPPGSAGTAGV